MSWPVGAARQLVLLRMEAVLDGFVHLRLLAVVRWQRRTFIVGNRVIQLVWPEDARLRRVVHHDVHDVVDLVADPLVEDWRADFDAALGISGHEISRGDVHFLLFPGAEAINPGVFEVAPDYAAHIDVFGDAGDAWHDAADAADNHVDLHAGARGFLELADDVHVGQGIELEEHFPIFPLSDLFVY